MYREEKTIMITVSICIPAYKNVELLKNVFESIKIQSFQDYEIIVSDDTPDNSIRELIQMLDFVQEIYYFHNKPNLGSPENWNAAIAKASGKYIKIIHTDDWFAHSESLATFVSMIESDTDIDFAFSGAQILSTSNEIRVHQADAKLIKALENDPKVLYRSNFVGGPSATIYKRSLNLTFDKNLKWLVDVDFYIRLLSIKPKFAYTTEPLVVTYEAAGRITNECIDNRDIQIFEHLYVYEKLKMIPGNSESRRNLVLLGYLCLRFNIKSIKEIRNLNYKGIIPLFILLLVKITSVSKFLGKAYLRIISPLLTLKS
ncbi:MAG: glycosyltransferase family 2 protein [Bacteroidota bacterium]